MSARRWLRAAAAWLACRLGVHHASRWLHRHELLICCYHGIREDDTGPEHWLLLPRRQLGEQLEYIARHYRCLPVEQAIEALRSGRLDGPTACITFDDGYASNRTIALPMLEALRLPATIYLTTGLVGTDRRLWTTALEVALVSSSAPTLDLTPLGERLVSLGAEASRRRLASTLVEKLKLRPHAERELLLRQLHAQLGTVAGEDDAAFALMDWDDARAMRSSGLISFGAHTINHDILSRVDDDRLESEVGGSMKMVSDNLGEPARTFAYPNGREIDFDARAKAAVRRAGGIAAMSTREGLNSAGEDLFALRRVVVGPEMTMDAFRLHTSGAISVLKALLEFAGPRKARAAALAAPAHSARMAQSGSGVAG